MVTHMIINQLRIRNSKYTLADLTITYTMTKQAHSQFVKAATAAPRIIALSILWIS